MSYLKSILLSIIITTSFSCSENIISPDNSSINNLMYLGIEGNSSGIWSYKNLNKLDSLITEPGVPLSLVLSQDGSKIYSIWKSENVYYLFQINSESLIIEKSIKIQTLNPFCLISHDYKFIIIYGNSGFEIYNRNDLTLYYIDKNYGNTLSATLSKSQSFLYLSIWENRKFIGIDIFDLQTKEIIKSIRPFEITDSRTLQDVDIKVDDSDKYLFISAFNWVGGGGFNLFFVVDLNNDLIISEYPTGAFAQLTKDNTGRYIYISDPAGFLYQFPRTNQILRYDIQNQKMEVYISLKNLDQIKANVFTSTYLSVNADNNFLYICVEGDVKTKNDERVDIIIFNISTHKIEDTFSFELVNNKLTKRIRSIKIK